MKQFFSFLFAFFVGFITPLIYLYPGKLNKMILHEVRSKPSLKTFESVTSYKHDFYSQTLSEILFKEVKLLCWIMTTPENHRTKAMHVKSTWGKRCNKLLFVSTQPDAELGVIALPVKEGRDTLWDKTKNGFQYIYKHHYEDADWFMKADDDNYMFPDNIRHMLYQYRPQTALYIGHRYATEALPEGYMAGGGYILSKSALNKLITRILPNGTICEMKDEGSEDWEMGKCLAHSAIQVDERDDKLQKRFFPGGLLQHLTPEKDPTYWYDNSQYYDVPQGNLACCSDTPAGFHYVTPKEMYLLDYLTTRVHPFGVKKNITDRLPRKLRLKEILRASDTESKSVNFKKHPIYHNLDESEKYTRK